MALISTFSFSKAPNFILFLVGDFFCLFISYATKMNKWKQYNKVVNVPGSNYSLKNGDY
jgi:hypothetical protein